MIGPALVAGVAYLDPGNVASNMTAGAQYGYLLVWVVVLGNVMAWLIQYLSAKLGLSTGELPRVGGFFVAVGACGSKDDHFRLAHSTKV